jgi:hypothetical protein
MRRLKSVVRLDRGGGSLGGRGVAVGEVRPKMVGLIAPLRQAPGENLAHGSSTSVDMFRHCSKMREPEFRLSRVKPQKVRNKKVDSANSAQKSVLLEDRPANDARKSETDLVWARFGVSVTHFCSL